MFKSLKSINNSLYCLGWMTSNQKDANGEKLFIHPEALENTVKCPVFFEHGYDKFGELPLGYINFMVYIPTLKALKQIRTEKIKILVGFTVTNKEMIEMILNREINLGLSAHWKFKGESVWVNPTTNIIMEEEVELIELSITNNPANSDAYFQISTKEELQKLYPQADFHLEKIKSETVFIESEDGILTVQKNGNISRLDTFLTNDNKSNNVMTYEEIKQAFGLTGSGAITINPDGTAVIAETVGDEKSADETQTEEIEVEVEESCTPDKTETMKSADMQPVETTQDGQVVPTEKAQEEIKKLAEVNPKVTDTNNQDGSHMKSIQDDSFLDKDYINYVANN